MRSRGFFSRLLMIVIVLLLLGLGGILYLRISAADSPDSGQKPPAAAPVGQTGGDAAEPEDIKAESEPELTPEPTPEISYEPGVPVVLDGTVIEDTILVEGVLYAASDAIRGAANPSFWSEYINDGVNTMELGEEVTVGGRAYAGIGAFCEAYGIRTYDDVNTFYATSAAGKWEVPGGYSIPILMYHGVSDSDLWTSDELFVSPAELRAQIEYLLANDYLPIWFEDLKHVDDIAASGKKAVLLTFDDGWLDTYTDAFPIFQEYNVKATYFVITGTLGNNDKVLTTEQVTELAASGLVDIQYHTDWHKDLPTLSYDEQIPELTWGKITIMRLTGKIPYALAYPEGKQNETTLEICRDEFNFAVKMSGAAYVTGQGDPLLIYRKYVPRGMYIGAFAGLLQ